jgi:hypothetical protein
MQIVHLIFKFKSKWAKFFELAVLFAVSLVNFPVGTKLAALFAST